MANIVTDYGAVADAQYATASLTITAGTPNLASGTALWSSGDVGKFIVVGGAGGAGNPLNATISAFVDSQHITLNTNAVTGLSAASHIVSWAATNNSTAFANFNAASQGATVSLTIPAGIYLIQNGNQQLFDGISSLTVNATGATLTGGIFSLGPSGQYQDNAHSARTASASAGSTSVTLSTPSQVSLFTVGQYALMAGLDMQAVGFPINQNFFDFVSVTAIDSNPASPTYGKITFSAPLSYDYLSTWPFYNGGGAFEVDHGGPATLYALHPSWNATMVFNGLTVAQDIATAGGGLSITFNSCTCISPNGIFPSVAASFSLLGCNWSACNVEIDKMIGSITVDNTTVNGLSLQSSSVKQLTISGGSVVGQLAGTPKSTVLKNSTLTSMSPGALFFGRSESIAANNCTINALGSGMANIDKGASDVGINNTAGVSMAGGIITFPSGYKGVGPVTWAVPGTHCFWSDTNGWVETGFQVLAVSQDGGGNTLVKTNLANSFLPPAFTATNIWVGVHPCPRATFRDCSGTAPDIAGLNVAPPASPLYSYQRHIYTSGADLAAAQPVYPVWGNLVQLSINVTHAYAGAGALTFAVGPSWPIIDSNNSHGVTIFYSAVVNAKIAGERIITLNGVTGQQAGDSGLAVPDSKQTWFTGGNAGTGPAFSADVSGSDPNVSVVVTFLADQYFPPASIPTLFRSSTRLQ